jgi:putative transposase
MKARSVFALFQLAHEDLSFCEVRAQRSAHVPINNELPHPTLNMRCPAECYVSSTRPNTGLPELDYPFHDKTLTVTTCGRICLNRQKINLSTVFAGQKVGIKQVSEEIWLVTFMDYDLGYFDHETCRLEPLDNPFEAKCYPCLRNKS